MSSINSARLGAVQLLYQMQTADMGAKQALMNKDDYFSGKELDGVNFIPADLDLLTKIVEGYEAKADEINEAITAVSKYKMERLEIILQCILKAGAYEILEGSEEYTKGKIISAYLDITSAFYDKKEIGIINVILDQVAKSI